MRSASHMQSSKMIFLEVTIGYEVGGCMTIDVMKLWLDGTIQPFGSEKKSRRITADEKSEDK